MWDLVIQRIRPNDGGLFDKVVSVPCRRGNSGQSFSRSESFVSYMDKMIDDFPSHLLWRILQ